MKLAIRNLLLLHLVGNALLLWCGYYWLGLGESSGGALAWSTFVALVCALAAIWLHGVALGQFGSDGPWLLRASLKSALRNLPPLLLIALAASGLYVLLWMWQVRSSGSAFKLASYLTLKLRKPIKPATVEHVLGVGFWLVRYAVLPVFLLPFAAAVAGRGWSGFRGRSWGSARRWTYWIETPALLACAFWVPLKLIAWVPKMRGFKMEMTSFALRALAAYLLMSGALLALEVLTGRGIASAGSPRSSQPTTVPSP
ncbi:MAG TPA: hypothetical protein VN893_20275 [Bryobacteraceae bacterium]|nr:hypothetical protein [Bryobacteraceae bacterium]